MMNYMKLLAIMASVVVMTPLQAKESWSPTEAELPMLPPVCVAKGTPDKQDDRYWSDLLGEGYMHLHHYCRGLVMFPRGIASRTARARVAAYEEAIQQFDYVIGRVSSNFLLLPEIYQNRGKALKLLNRPDEAITNLNKALELNRELVGAYTLLADIYEEQKNKAEALKQVTEALKYLPDSNGLKKRYQRLGGIAPYPEPYAKPEQSAPAAQPVEAMEAGSPVVSAGAVPDAPATASESKTAPSDQPASGVFNPNNRKNPWCRFCPD